MKKGSRKNSTQINSQELEGQANKDVFPCQRTLFHHGSVQQFIVNRSNPAALASWLRKARA
jgi:hypothetical protein